MDYRKHRPWIFSALAIAFCAVAFWYAMPRDKGKKNPPPANEPAPANNGNTTPSIGPAPDGNESGE